MHNTLDYTIMTGHKSAYKNFKTHLSPSQRKGRYKLNLWVWKQHQVMRMKANEKHKWKWQTDIDCWHNDEDGEEPCRPLKWLTMCKRWVTMLNG